MSRHPIWQRLALAVGLAGISLQAQATGPLSDVRHWGVYYGAPLAAPALKPFDLLVLEPDQPWDLPKVRRPGQRFLAYLSLGEVHTSRPYYPALSKTAGAIFGPNPNWEGAMRVDPRAEAWTKALLQDVVPGILARGYDGLFLDTVDVGYWLERYNKQAGAAQAMANLIKALHQQFPAALLMANGGFELLPAMAPALAAVATESVVTDYQFKPGKYRWRDGPGQAARLTEVQAVVSTHALPVFVIEYVDPQYHAMRKEAEVKLQAAGLIPYVAPIGLDTLLEPP